MFVFLLSLTACQQEEPPASATKTTGVVEATQAYLENFGTPPQGKSGQAFGRVGYLPLQKTPDKLRPLPLFLFSEKGQLRQILERLASGDLLLQRRSELYNPFPDDLEITVTSPEGPTTTISLTTQQSWANTDLTAAGQALAETTLQFAKVNRVIVLHNGAPLPQMPADGYLHEPQLLVKVEPPQLVLIAGVWENGSDALSEILVEFDRPIKVNNFDLYDEAGKAVDGDYFTSIFQMAVVVHPKEPSRYPEAALLRAEWDVVDDLGRSNRGTDTLPLRRIDH
jgi:hypothetical protein